MEITVESVRNALLLQLDTATRFKRHGDIEQLQKQLQELADAEVAYDSGELSEEGSKDPKLVCVINNE